MIDDLNTTLNHRPLALSPLSTSQLVTQSLLPNLIILLLTRFTYVMATLTRHL